MTETTVHDAAAAGRFALLVRYLRRYRRYLWWGAVAVVLANVLSLVNPYIIKVVFDRLEQKAPMITVGKLLLLMVLLEAVAGLFRFMMRRTIIWMSRHIEYHLRSDLVRHLLTLPVSFYDQSRTGDIMARATNDIEAVRLMVGPAIMQATNTVVTIAVAVPFMIYLSPRLTMYALLPALVFPFLMHRMGKLVHQRFMKIQQHFATLTAAAQENLAGIRLIKAYRQEEPETEHFADLSSQYVDLNMSLARVMAVFMPVVMLLAGLLGLVVLYFGGKDVIGGRIPLGTIVAFFIYLTRLMWPMMAIGWVVNLYQRGSASLARLNAIMNTPPEVTADGKPRHTDRIRGEVEFRHLQFAYDGAPVLRDITLHVPPGCTVGIVGMTGAGKTTLVSLLSRMYPVGRGMLFIDGVDINDWHPAALRAQIGCAPQEPFLFSDTIGGNIAFGAISVESDQVRNAAAIAALHKDISEFPDAYDTVVGERGITLSGGQKQRVAIARALLIEPAILVLDDVTSAVDTHTEDEINNAFADLKHRRTTFIISHRVSSVKEADIIIYLEQGRIVEQGSHHELMRLDGHYATLYRQQLLQQELQAQR